MIVIDLQNAVETYTPLFKLYSLIVYDENDYSDPGDPNCGVRTTTFSFICKSHTSNRM